MACMLVKYFILEILDLVNDQREPNTAHRPHAAGRAREWEHEQWRHARFHALSQL